MKPKISPIAITTLLAARYSRIEGLWQLAEGEESQAYAAVADGQQIVVRINSRREGFDKDAFIAELWPTRWVPKVMAIEPLSDAWLCISERMPGVTLQALGRGAESCAQEVLEVLDSIAASDVSSIVGYGPFSASGIGICPSWQAFVASIDGPRDLVRLVCEYQYGEKRALVHGDFGSNNVLAENGTVTGVIDWSEALIGDPLYDIANLFFWRPWLECMEVQCQYLALHRADRLIDQELLTRYQVRIGLQVAAEARADGDEKMEQWALDRSRKIALL
jgi:hygromycin-B 4-O-kinase